MMHAAEWFGCGCGAVPLCAWGHWRQSMMMILSLVILRALMEQLQVSRSQVLGQEFENAMISLCTGRSYYVFIMFYQFNTETLVIMTKISSSCTLRTCEASHGGKHCDSVGEDQTCYRSEFARAEGMVVAQHQFFFLCVLYSSLKTENLTRKAKHGAIWELLGTVAKHDFCMPEGATDHQASSGLSLLLRRYCLDLRTLKLPQSDMSDWSRSNHVILYRWPEVLCFAYASSYASRVLPLMAGLLGNAEVLDSGCGAEGCMLHTAPNIRSITIYMYIILFFI